MKKLFYFLLLLTSVNLLHAQTVPVVDQIEFTNSTSSKYFLASLLDKNVNTCGSFYLPPTGYQYDVPPSMTYTHNYVVDGSGQPMSQCGIGGVIFKENSTGYIVSTLFCDNNGNFLYSGSKQVATLVNGRFKYFVITWSIPSVVFQGIRVCLYGSGKAKITIDEL